MVANNSAPPVIKRENFRGLVARRSDALHPWRYITGAAGRGAALGRVKRLAVWLLYEYMARTYWQADWTTMNYGYATLQGENGRTVVDPAIPERLSLQLYMRVATAGVRGGAWDGLDVLEIGSGRGGGAAYLAHRLAPGDWSASTFPPPRQLSPDGVMVRRLLLSTVRATRKRFRSVSRLLTSF
jgi:hypothetical protein